MTQNQTNGTEQASPPGSLPETSYVILKRDRYDTESVSIVAIFFASTEAEFALRRLTENSEHATLLRGDFGLEKVSNVISHVSHLHSWRQTQDCLACVLEGKNPRPPEPFAEKSKS